MRSCLIAVLLLAAVPAFPQDPAEMTRDELVDLVKAQRHVLADWAGLIQYGSVDTEVKPAKAGENRVVFLGDDITEHWSDAAGSFFPGKPYFNRGIARQITPQLLVRFRQDVISLHPKVVVIQAGTNDIAGILGGGTEGTMSENFASMVD